MATRDYSIQDLTDQTGLPRRTIHFYTQQQILPPPQGAGLGARYGDEHLLRLRLIPLLRGQGLRLDDIRQRLNALDENAMRELLASAQSLPAAPPPAAAPQAFQHYPLQGGITIVAPHTLNPVDRRKLYELLEAARRIFNDPADGSRSV